MDLTSLSDDELRNMANSKVASNSGGRSSSLDQMSTDELRGLAKQKEKTSSSFSPMASLEGFGQGAAMGYLPQLQAAIEPVQSKITDAFTGKNVSSDMPGYVQRRDENIKRQESLAKESPTSYYGGLLPGAVSGAMAPGALVGGGVKAAEGAGILGKLAKGAVGGAAVGAAQNPGDKEGVVDPYQMEERLEGAKQGAAFGVGGEAAGLVASKVGKGLMNAGKSMKGMSAGLALEQAGARKADYKRLYGKRLGDEKIQELGDTIKTFMSPGDTFEDIYQKSHNLMKGAGKKIGEVYSNIEDTVTSPNFLSSLKPDKLEKLQSTALIGKDIADEIRGELSGNLKNNLNRKKVTAQLDRYLNDLSSRGEIGIKDAHEIRVNLDKDINWDRSVKDMPAVQDALTKVRAKLENRIINRIEALDSALGSKHVKDLKEVNKFYSNLSEINRISGDKTAAMKANARFGLLELGGGLGGVASSNSDDSTGERLLKGAAGAMAVKGLRRYGPGIASKALSGAGVVAEPLGKIPGYPLEAIGSQFENYPYLGGAAAEAIRKRKEQADQYE